MQITAEIEELILTYPVVVISHTPCIDGFCSAFVFKLYLELLEATAPRPLDVTFVGGSHTAKLSNIPDVRGKVVFIFDFSFDRKQLIELNTKAKKLLVLDHHATAEKTLAGLPFCHFDMTKSGAKLVADFVQAKKLKEILNLPSLCALVDYVSDRDLWSFSLPESDTINLAIGSWPYLFDSSAHFEESFKVWKSYAALPVEDFIPRLVHEGRIVGRQLTKMVDDAMRFTRLGQLRGRTDVVPVVNVYPHIVSETLNKLLQKHDYPYAIGWYFDGLKYVYSFRSIDKVHVGELAKRYGGGGHKNAAGFTSPDFFIETFESQSWADQKERHRLGL